MLQKPSFYKLLSRSGCYTVNGIDDEKEFIFTRKALTIIGFDGDEQDFIFRAVSAILYLGNIEFRETEEGDATKNNPLYVWIKSI